MILVSNQLKLNKLSSFLLGTSGSKGFFFNVVTNKEQNTTDQSPLFNPLLGFMIRVFAPLNKYFLKQIVFIPCLFHKVKAGEKNCISGQYPGRMNGMPTKAMLILSVSHLLVLCTTYGRITVICLFFHFIPKTA